ncbi:MAG: hypothetical protein J7J76_07890 [Candidatus Latescibacteria bacterium]|nr:hypothetical protein [Candidatus Latescibacterota bacterium]
MRNSCLAYSFTICSECPRDEKIVNRGSKAFPEENFWTNPNCGLKTRGCEETKGALRNLVELAKRLREETRGGAG